MILNELQEDKLAEALGSVLCLEAAETVLATFAKVFHISIANRQDLLCQTQLLVQYRGYRIDVMDIRAAREAGVSLIMQFKCPQRWWHGLLKDQNAPVVRDLQRMCIRQMPGLSFSHYTKTVQPYFDDGSATLHYFHDARALNEQWRSGYEISPLLIAPDAHDQKCFVEFLFNGGAYARRDEGTVLRENWMDSIGDIKEGIERDARKLLDPN